MLPLDQAKARVFDTVVVNEEPTERLLGAYAEEGQLPVTVDRAGIEALGIQFVPARVISETETVRHDPQKLAEAILQVIDEHVAERASLLRVRIPAPARNATSGSA